MKVALGLVLWLAISAGLLLWLRENGLVPEDDAAFQTMVVGCLTFGAFAAGLVWAGFRSLRRKG